MKTFITIIISLVIGLAIGYYVHKPAPIIEYADPTPNAVTIPGFNVQY